MSVLLTLLHALAHEIPIENWDSNEAILAHRTELSRDRSMTKLTLATMPGRHPMLRAAILDMPVCMGVHVSIAQQSTR